MLGSEFGAVDVTRDEVSDYCRHSVYQGGVINAGTDPGDEAEHTLGIEENGVVHEVLPLEHTPQFRDVLLSIRSHCANPLLVKTNLINILPPRLHCLSSPMNIIFLSVGLYLANIGK